MKRLRQMLKYKRPHGSRTEVEWIQTFIMPYDPEFFGEGDEVYAMAVTVNREDGSLPEVLFSGHTDTVHRREGRQKLFEKGSVIAKRDGEPLGADDAAGCWVMLEMIDAGVPGVYLFHRGEEQGGIGSKWMRTNGADWLSQFKAAVAFDRKATHSVITHQGGRKCCSNEFASALADALNEQNDNFMYVDDDTGVYTDTKEYVGIIPECTNLSVGYYEEHRPTERLDVDHVISLRNACIAIDWHALPSVRDVSKVEYKDYGFGRWPKSKSTVQGGLALDVDEAVLAYFEQRYGRVK